MKTISAEHATDLYELLDGDNGAVDPNPPLDDNFVAHNWVVLGSAPSRTSRWHERYWLVLRAEDGTVWGIEYGVGLTENQEGDLPWEDGPDELALTQLYPREVTTVEYRTRP